jgi:hypothetical protein
MEKLQSFFSPSPYGTQLFSSSEEVYKKNAKSVGNCAENDDTEEVIIKKGKPKWWKDKFPKVTKVTGKMTSKIYKSRSDGDIRKLKQGRKWKMTTPRQGESLFLKSTLKQSEEEFSVRISLLEIEQSFLIKA